MYCQRSDNAHHVACVPPPLYSKCHASQGIPALYQPLAFNTFSCSGVTASSLELPYTSIAIPFSCSDFHGSAIECPAFLSFCAVSDGLLWLKAIQFSSAISFIVCTWSLNHATQSLNTNGVQFAVS